MNLKAELEQGYYAIRNTVALEEETDLRCLLLTGNGAFNVLDLICPCDVFLQNGQIKHTLLLDEEGIPFADVYVCREGENAYLLGYGPQSRYIIEWIKQYSQAIADYSIIDLMESYCAFSLNGPYAWELCAEVLGSDVLGLPYLSMATLNNKIVFRAGMTGEYGYHLLIPTAEKNSWLATLLDKGSAYELAMTDSAARSQCSLENFFFDLNREGSYGLSPQELQLQWRLSRQKTTYPGAKAIKRIREKGWDQRLTCFISKNPINVNEEIFCDTKSIGSVLAVGYSPLRKEFIGKALLRRPYWNAGLDCFQVGDRSLYTISAPAINNLSLTISPYIDSYFNKREIPK